MKILKYLSIIFLISNLFFLNSCGMFKKVDQRTMPDGPEAKARKNVEEGRGISLGNIGKRGSTNYEFSSSNPMWRSSLEILDFLPLTTVDYSGGIIITDWYSDNNDDDSIKISVRFLSNEIRSDNLKITVHKKICDKGLNCRVNLVKNSAISSELLSAILKKAAVFERENKKKNKK
jgi:hypothetical protein